MGVRLKNPPRYLGGYQLPAFFKRLLATHFANAPAYCGWRGRQPLQPRRLRSPTRACACLTT